MDQNDINGEDFHIAVFSGDMTTVEAYITSGGDIEYQAVRRKRKVKTDTFLMVSYYSSDESLYSDDDDDNDINEADVTTADAIAIDDNIGYTTIYRSLGRVSEEIGNLLHTL